MRLVDGMIMTLLSVDVEVRCSLGIAVPDDLFGLVTQDVDTDIRRAPGVSRASLMGYPRNTRRIPLSGSWNV
jgi:hypothetical protein